MWGATNEAGADLPPSKDRGITPRVFEELFARMQQVLLSSNWNSDFDWVGAVIVRRSDLMMLCYVVYRFPNCVCCIPTDNLALSLQEEELNTDKALRYQCRCSFLEVSVHTILRIFNWFTAILSGFIVNLSWMESWTTELLPYFLLFSGVICWPCLVCFCHHLSALMPHACSTIWQIYNEQITDLLDPSQKNLQVWLDGRKLTAIIKILDLKRLWDYLSLLQHDNVYFKNFFPLCFNISF